MRLVTLAATPILLAALVLANCADVTVSSITNTAITADMANDILKVHNDARQAVNPTAKKMPMLQWDDGLASGAQTYLDACPGFKHSSSATRSNVVGTSQTFKNVGENLAAGPQLNPSGFKTSSELWVEEGTVWTHEATCSGKVCGQCATTSKITSCGHYTQVVWADTTHIGCGYKECSGQRVYACWYGPAGNWIGQAPYEAGTPEAGSCTAAPAPTVACSSAGAQAVVTDLNSVCLQNVNADANVCGANANVEGTSSGITRPLAANKATCQQLGAWATENSYWSCSGTTAAKAVYDACQNSGSAAVVSLGALVAAVFALAL